MFERQQDNLGHKVRDAYASFGLSDEQKRSHRTQLDTIGQRRPDRRQIAEVAAIAVLAVLVLAGALVWQALPNRDAGRSAAPSDSPESSIAAIERERERSIPHAPPATCPVTEWSGPEQRITGEDPDWQLSYYLDGSGIALNSRLGLFTTGENQIRWLSSATPLPQDTRYTVSMMTDAGRQANLLSTARSYTAPAFPDPEQSLLVQPASIVFPETGCWRIRAEAEQAGFGIDAIVYVYPGNE